MGSFAVNSLNLMLPVAETALYMSGTIMQMRHRLWNHWLWRNCALYVLLKIEGCSQPQVVVWSLLTTMGGLKFRSQSEAGTKNSQDLDTFVHHHWNKHPELGGCLDICETCFISHFPSQLFRHLRPSHSRGADQCVRVMRK